MGRESVTSITELMAVVTCAGKPERRFTHTSRWRDVKINEAMSEFTFDVTISEEAISTFLRIGTFNYSLRC
jgi:hypothetical protein